jgi:hypothetical protein
LLFYGAVFKAEMAVLGALNAALNVGFKTMIVIMELNKILSKLIKEKIKEIKIMMATSARVKKAENRLKFCL